MRMRLGLRGVIPANFLSWATDILVGVGLGCLLQISRSHTDVKVSGQTLVPGPLLMWTPQVGDFTSRRASACWGGALSEFGTSLIGRMF